MIRSVHALLPPDGDSEEAAVLTKLKLAHIGQEAENKVAGVPCGLMDQLACQFGIPGQ